jgi:acetylornithine deacetylase
LLDIRTTPAYEHEELARILRDTLSSAELEIVSTRLKPASTPANSKLLAALKRVRPGACPFGSPTTSDWVWMRDLDAIKLGPGDSRQSHRADECIRLAEIDEAAALYAAVAREYLA